jgi:hypothetical protein
VATWWSPFVDGPTGYRTPVDPKGYIQPPADFATPALGGAVPSNGGKFIFGRLSEIRITTADELIGTTAAALTFDGAMALPAAFLERELCA